MTDRHTQPAVSALRETRVTDTFVMLADSLVADFDVVDVLDHLVTTCVELLPVETVGMLLDDQAGGLAVVAASDHDSQSLEIFQVQHVQGPCRDCVRTGSPVVCEDLADARGRWPDFVPVALGRGVRSVVAVPLRLRGETVGALGLFRAGTGPLRHEDLHLAQAFADVATIGILQHRSAHRSLMIAEQLRFALDSRVVIEQAKGILVERRHLTMTAAFGQLRRHARNHNLKLTAVAMAVVRGELEVDRD